MNKFLTGGLVVGLMVSTLYLAIYGPVAPAVTAKIVVANTEPAATAPENSGPAVVQRKPTLLIFTSKGCVPCLRMKSITFPVLKSEMTQFEVMELDVNDAKNSEYVHCYAGYGVPSYAIVVYDSSGKAASVRKAVGFMVVAEFRKFLRGD